MSKDKVEYIKPIEWPKYMDDMIEAREKLDKAMREAMMLPKEFFPKTKKVSLMIKLVNSFKRYLNSKE